MSPASLLTLLAVLGVPGDHVVSALLAPHEPLTGGGGGQHLQAHARAPLLLLHPGEDLPLRPVQLLPQVSEPLGPVPVRRPANKAKISSSCKIIVFGGFNEVMENIDFLVDGFKTTYLKQCFSIFFSHHCHHYHHCHHCHHCHHYHHCHHCHRCCQLDHCQ